MPLDDEKLMRMKFEPATHRYTKKDTILYAIGVGVGSQDPFNPAELKYVYEKSLVALPILRNISRTRRPLRGVVSSMF